MLYHFQVVDLFTLLTAANLLTPSSCAGSPPPPSSASTSAAYRRPKLNRPIPICQYARAKKRLVAETETEREIELGSNTVFIIVEYLFNRWQV